MNVFHGRDSSLSSISGSLVDSSCSISTTGDGSPAISPISSPYLSPGLGGGNNVVGRGSGFAITAAAAMSGAGAGFLVRGGSGSGSGSGSESPHYHSSADTNYQTVTSSSSLHLPTTTTDSKSSQNNDKLPTTGNTTFVHKLYNMVVDKQSQHLIAWNYTGTSFIVCDITEFSKEVLPKHFKHSNFSSFVRQLNMYGFHKVNKSPRGHKTLAENQIWEFSHSKFIKNRADLLDEIKRKSIENHNGNSNSNNNNNSHYATEHHAISKTYYTHPFSNYTMGTNQSSGNVGQITANSYYFNSSNHQGMDAHISSNNSISNSNIQSLPFHCTADYLRQQRQHEMLTKIQVSQTDLLQKLAQLQENFNVIVNELAETKITQAKQQQVLQNMMNFLTVKHKNDQQMSQQQQQATDPMIIVETAPPSIFITSHDNTNPATPITAANNTHHLNHRRNQPPPPPILTDNLSPMMATSNTSQQASPALSAYHTALNTPISPLNSPNPFVMISDENMQIPNIPTTTTTSNHNSNDSFHHLTLALNDTNISHQQQQQQQQQQGFYTTATQQVFYHNENNISNGDVLIHANGNHDRMMIDPSVSASSSTTTASLVPANYNRFFMHRQQQQQQQEI